MAQVLVDTGAKINLIPPGFLPDSKLFDTPKHNINLMVVDEQSMRGGERACTTHLQFFKEHIDISHNTLNEHTSMAMYAYEGDIGYDLSIDNPWLFDNHVAPFAYRGQLFQGDPDNKEEPACWLLPKYKSNPDDWDRHVRE